MKVLEVSSNLDKTLIVKVSDGAMHGIHMLVSMTLTLTLKMFERRVFLFLFFYLLSY